MACERAAARAKASAVKICDRLARACSKKAEKGKEVSINDSLRMAHLGMQGADAVRALLKRGADPNIDQGRALEKYALFGCADVVRAFLEHGADPNAGHALRAACIDGKVEVVELLLEYSAIPTQSALYTACAYGYEDIARLLLERGASATAEKYRILREACREGSAGIVKLFIKYLSADEIRKAPGDLIARACSARSSAIAEMLLLAGYRPANIDQAINGAILMELTRVVRLLRSIKDN